MRDTRNSLGELQMFSGIIEFISEDFAWFEGVLYDLGIDIDYLVEEILWL
jgi:hypothetical protein